jgi:hypothetical protein
MERGTEFYFSLEQKKVRKTYQRQEISLQVIRREVWLTPVNKGFTQQ